METQEVRLAGVTDVRFPFTNYSDEDFIGRWDSKDYSFPAQTTIVLLGLILNATPLELQGIRKKFAKDLAEREFFKTKKHKELLDREKNSDGTPRLSSFQHASSYSDNDLKDLIQQALTPLQIGKSEVRDVITENIIERLHRDDEGNLVTEAISSKTSLRKKALES